MSALGRHKGSLILVVLAAIAAIAYLLIDKGTVSTQEATRRGGQLLPAWRKAEISVIDLMRGGDHLRLERDVVADAGELDYRMSAPESGAPIDAEAVDRLLLALEFAKVERKLDAEPSQFGETLLSLQLTMGRVQYAFDLGGEAAVPAGAHYLRITRVEGAPQGMLGVYVVPAELVAELTVPLWEFRSKQIVPYLSIALASIEVQRDAHTLRLERIDPISFRVRANGVPALRASRKRIDRLWQALADSRIEYFPASALKIAAPRVVLRMQPQQGAPAELRYGEPCPEHPELIQVERIGTEPMMGCVPASVLDGFAIEPSDLLDQGLFALYFDELEELTATRGDERIELAREGAGFRQRGGQLLTTLPLENALRYLFEVTGAGSTASANTFVREASVRIGGGHGAPGGEGIEEEIELGTCNGVAACVHRRGDDGYVTLSARDMARIRPSLVWTKSDDVGAVRERPARIELVCEGAQSGATAGQRLERSNVEYIYEKPLQLPVDQARALELADRVRRIRASAWVTPSASEVDFGFHGCVIRAWDEQDAGPAFAIEIGAASGAELRFARLESRSEVFLVDAELEAAARRLYVQRALWASDEPIYQLRVSGAVRRQFYRVDGADGGTSRGVDGSADSAALAWVENLRADEVLHLGSPRPEERMNKPWLILEADGDDRTQHIYIQKNEHGGWARVMGVDATFQLEPARIEELERMFVTPADAGAP